MEQQENRSNGKSTHSNRERAELKAELIAGHTTKTVTTETGPVQVRVPRDREGTFEPQLVKKHQSRLGVKTPSGPNRSPSV